ncbi:hypothetical protein FRC04_002836 [Tulasnella sp. 424]|nr:hypothetical protein FRC04_002836 [Tulasnella sp. 424]
MLPPPLEKFTPVMTDADHVEYPAWTDQAFASFNGAQNGRSDSESTSVSRRGSRPTESTQFDGHWLATGSALVQSPKLLPPPLEKSTPVMTDAGHVVYPAWADQPFASFNGAQNGRSDSESTLVSRRGSRPMESTQYDGHWLTTGSALVQSSKMLPPPLEKFTSVMTDAGHVVYPASTDQFGSFNGTENDLNHSESPSAPFTSAGILYNYRWTSELADHGLVHYPGEA